MHNDMSMCLLTIFSQLVTQGMHAKSHENSFQLPLSSMFALEDGINLLPIHCHYPLPMDTNS